MQAELPTLLELQEKDRLLQELEDEIRGFEPELAELDAELAEYETRLNAARQGVEDAAKRRVELEQKIENFRQMQERRRQRLEWVRGAKEASTLMAELDLGRSVLAKEEAEWVRSADKVQEAQQAAADLEREIEDVQARQTERREAIAGQQADLRTRVEEATGERAAVADKIDRGTLQRYERIRKGRAPLALYALHGEACGHCFTSVPRHRRQELQHGVGTVMCEGCGVLVYDPETLPSP